jgi:hypothetical protein
MGHARAIATGVGALAFSRRARTCLLGVCALLCACLAWSASADALSQRGHVFTSAFGTLGEGDGQLSNPGQVAVNETTGDVYVVDRGNDRIDRFASDGAFISTWGFGVTDGAQEFEVCTSGCKAGTGKGALQSPGAIAVDNSSGPSVGDVYVVMDSNLKGGALWKFNAAGGPPGEAKKPVVIKQEGESKWEGALDGVAVDASGNLWVYRSSSEELTEGAVEGFNGKEEEKLTKAQREEKEAKGEGRGEANEYREIQIEPELSSEALEQKKEGAEFLCPKPGFAVDAAAGQMFLGHENTNASAECPAEVIKEEEEANKKATPVEKLRKDVPAKFRFFISEELPTMEGQIASLNSQNTSAIAVDQASSASTPLGEIAKGDAYFASEQSLAAVDSSGQPIQRLTLPGTAPAAAGVAISAKTGTVYVADSANGQIEVATPAPIAAPTVDSVFPQVLSSTSAKIFAQIDPHGAETHAVLLVGTQSCSADPGVCTEVPMQPSDLGSGFGDVTAEAQLTGLVPNTQYFYRVIAHGSGTGESPDESTTFFTTLPTAEGLLADHREWEMVSPPVKGGPLLMPYDGEPGAMQSATDGSAFAFPAAASGPTGEAGGNRSKQVTQLLFTRGEAGWSAQNLSTPHNTGEGQTPSEPPEYQAFSPELSLSVLWPEARTQFPLENPPLSPALTPSELGHQEKTIYLRANSPIAPVPAEAKSYNEAAANRNYLAPGYLALVTQVNDTAGNPFGASLGVAGNGYIDASPDLNHVVISSPVGLTSGVSGEGLYEWNSESPNHVLQLVSVLPGGEQLARIPQLGGFGNSRHAISEDGTRVIFTGGPVGEGVENEGAHLYMRNTATHETTEINAVQGSHAPPTPLDEENEEIDIARYQSATPDGSKVFFEDTWPLTDDSKLAPTGASPSDLYEYDANTKKLSDLTVDPHNGESADVLGTIPGLGEDGANVYFVANGALAPGATPGNCSVASTEPVSTSCTLYVSEPNPQQPGTRQTRLIARLSGDDAYDWDRGVESREGQYQQDLTFLSSRVSPNGRYLAFMSDRSLTGYDNEDATSKSPGERMDEEVFIYDAQQNRLVCASCNPDSSKRPTGVFDEERAGEGVFLTVDPTGMWGGRWLAGLIPGWSPIVSATRSTHQPAYLSDSGRLFFDGADALVSQDQNTRSESIGGVNETVGVVDVYEFEPEGIGSCAATAGCTTLVSSGTDSRESAFLGASSNGSDAFFLTGARLLGPDVDSANDIYDARICGTSESGACLPPFSPPPPECRGEEQCKAPAPGPPSFSSGATSSFAGPGNTPTTGVLNSKTVKPTPKKLTRAQLLAKALKACKKQKKKKKRVACEKQAHKKYGKKASKKATKKKAKKSSAHKSAVSTTGGAR